MVLNLEELDLPEKIKKIERVDESTMKVIDNYFAPTYRRIEKTNKDMKLFGATPTFWYRAFYSVANKIVPHEPSKNPRCYTDMLIFCPRDL